MTIPVAGIDLFVIDGITFRGRPTEAAPGAFFLPEGVQGWRGGVSVRAEDVPRTSADGAFATPARLEARTSQWSAVVLATNENELGEWEERITGIGVNRFFQVTGQSMGRVLLSRARAAVTPTFKRRAGTWAGMVVADTDFQLVHPDPFLYGEEIAFEGQSQLVIESPGAAPSWPTFTVKGAGSPYSINGAGCSFQMNLALPVGQVDVIESASMTVRRNGVAMQSGFSGTLAPAPRARQRVTYSLSAGSLSAIVRPRFL